MAKSSKSPALACALAVLAVAVAIAAVAGSATAQTATPVPETPTGASNEAGCARDLATVVQARYDVVRDFKAGFRQQTRSVALGGQSLGDDAPSEGTVVFSKPGRMRWRYTRPRASEVISNGTTLWIVDPTVKEAQRLPVTEGYLTGAALEFLLGDGKLLETFDVTAVDCAPDDQGLVELVLDPKTDASYERLRLWANSNTGDIARTSLVDLFGNETEISFSQVVVNAPAEAGAFDYVPGPGVSVIDLTPSR
ncbi:MAG: outer membrane lipoprotein carrier protein LolA [Myxococcota bacterium]|jgi:outer membrane lipoprotein-sorting protein|nr:outer membrane lipoprotein carrier protein LolA [Myxococcota bacterium]